MTDVIDDWLTLEDISADLRVPMQTLYNWRSSGEGPPGYKLGRLVRVKRADYEAWLAARREVATA